MTIFNPAALNSGLRSGALLAVVAVLGVGLLSLVHELTADRIAEQERLAVLERLGQVLDPKRYNNDPLSDYITVRDEQAFPGGQQVRVHRARQDGVPVASIFALTAPDGYSGDIALLVGIYADGRISGVRVTAHRETPGLGDPIEAQRSDWIDSFRERSLTNPAPSGWAVRKDGGKFDQFTGDTVTPRAVVAAVRRALEFHAARGPELFELPAEPDSDAAAANPGTDELGGAVQP